MAQLLEEMSRVSDAELVRRLDRLVTADRALCAKLLVHLSELEERKLYLARGYSSMYDYCRTALRMSDAETYFRLTVAKVCRQFPVALERLGAGSVHLTGIKLLAPYLTADNHVQLLDRAQGMSKQQITVLIAELDPKPDAPARLRKVPTKRAPLVSLLPAETEPKPKEAAMLAASSLQSRHGAASAAPTASEAFALQSPPARGSTKPLGPGRFKLEVTLGQEAHDKLEQLQELLRHQHPSGDLAKIIERALSELLDREMKRRFAQTSAPRKRVAKQSAADEPELPREAKSQPTRSRYIPREVMREVYARDAGQCTFTSAEGRRCKAKGFLELDHHRTTFARGGEPTADNLRLACRAHNFFLAEQQYGQTFMQEKVQVATTNRARPATQETSFQT